MGKVKDKQTVSRKPCKKHSRVSKKKQLRAKYLSKHVAVQKTEAEKFMSRKKTMSTSSQKLELSPKGLRNKKRTKKNESVSFMNKTVNPKSFVVNEGEKGVETTCETVKSCEEKNKKPVKRPAASNDVRDDSVNNDEDFLHMETSEDEKTDEDSEDLREVGETDNEMNVEDLGDNDENEYDSANEYDSTNEPTPKLISCKKNLLTKTEKMISKWTKKNIIKFVKENSPMKQDNKNKKQEIPKANVTKILPQQEKKSIKNLKQQPDNASVKKTETVEDSSTDKNATIGFVGSIPKEVNEADIREALSTKMNPEEIVCVFLKKKRSGGRKGHALIVFKNVDSLKSVTNHELKVKDFTFSVQKAKKTPAMKPAALLPRVPSVLDNDSIKQVIETYVGEGNLIDFELISEFQETKNLLVYFSTIDVAKQAIMKGEYNVKGLSVIVKEARESGIEITVYRAVISGVSEKTTKEDLKESLEAKIGQDTIQSITFSFNKHSLAFVVFKSEEAQKKALELGDTLKVKNVKVKVIGYIPRQEAAKCDAANKRIKSKRSKNENKIEQNTESKESDDDSKPPKMKKMKIEKKKVVGKSNKNIKGKKKRNVASPTGEVKMKKILTCKKSTNLIQNKKVAYSSTDKINKLINGN